MKCFSCAMEIPDDAKQCPHCGTTTSKLEFFFKNINSAIFGLVFIIIMSFIAYSLFVSVFG